MGPSRSVDIDHVRRRLRRVSTACGVSAVVLVVLGWSGLMFAVGGVVIPPWATAGVLCGIAIVLEVISRRNRGGPEDQPATRERSRMGNLQLVGIILGFVGAILALLGDAAYGATYTLLNPTGPGGCQVVARETSFWMSGEGQVYAVHPFGVGWRAGSWTADDGVRPIENGRYRLSWGIGGGALLLQADSFNPVWPGLHEVSCL